MTRPLVLIGPDALEVSGLARAISGLTGAPVVDVAESARERAGAAPSGNELARLVRELFAAGSSSARAQVILLPGDALADRALRLLALESAVVIALGDGALVGGEAHAVLAAGSDAERAERACSLWEREPIVVAAGTRSYLVDVGADIVTRLERQPERCSSILLVTDDNVAKLHGERVRSALEKSGRAVSYVVLEPGEDKKGIASIERIWSAAFEGGIDRKSRLFALGGGVVTDMAGFAAATWMRGIEWVALPSTLLGMVDASVGGKTAIDFRSAKNAVGAFWQPQAVLCDVSLLATEPARGYRSALAEVVKTAVIGDPALMALLEGRLGDVRARDPHLVSEMVRRSIQVKAGIVSRDEREAGLRAVLNLGHTIGHGLEAEAGYTALSHGEAVSLGLVAALRLGRLLGVGAPGLAPRVTALLEALGLPVELEREKLERAAELVMHDKKRAGSKLRFVLARDVGDVTTQEIPLTELRALIPEVVTGGGGRS
jgi:shikimate kinase/3-dehydroquinate synthase